MNNIFNSLDVQERLEEESGPRAHIKRSKCYEIYGKEAEEEAVITVDVDDNDDGDEDEERTKFSLPVSERKVAPKTDIIHFMKQAFISLFYSRTPDSG